MNPLYHDAIERRLAVPLHKGPDKTTTLGEAIRRHVHSGDPVYLGSAHGRRAAREACGWDLQVALRPRRYFLGQ
jgi:hypothetical protein